MHPRKVFNDGYKCVGCGTKVWLPFRDARLVENGDKECKCNKCSTEKIWRE